MFPGPGSVVVLESVPGAAVDQHRKARPDAVCGQSVVFLGGEPCNEGTGSSGKCGASRSAILTSIARFWGVLTSTVCSGAVPASIIRGAVVTECCWCWHSLSASQSGCSVLVPGQGSARSLGSVPTVRNEWFLKGLAMGWIGFPCSASGPAFRTWSARGFR